MRIFNSACFLLIAFAAPAAAQSNDELIVRTKDPDARQRRLAAEKLGKQKVESAIPALAGLLTDKEGEVRHAAVDALVNIGPKSVPVLAEALGSKNDSTRMLAAGALVDLGAEAKAAVPALIVALKDKTVDVRIHAAVVLGQIGADAKSALPALHEAAKDLGNVGPVVRAGISSSVTEAATGAALLIDPKCGESLAKAVLPDLVKALKSDNAGEVQAAAFAIRELGIHAKSALPALEEAVKADKGFSATALKSLIAKIKGESDKDDEIAKDTKQPLEKRLDALLKLGWSKQPPEKVLPVLLELLRDDEPRIRHTAVQQIWYGKYKSKEAIAALMERLGDDALEIAGNKSGGVGDLVPQALASMGKDAAAPLAAVLLDKKQKPFVRFRAARAISLLGPNASAVRSDLEAAIDDRLLLVATEAACAYVRSGGDFAKAKDVLADGLGDKVTFIAWTAAYALERIGPAGKVMVPELTAALKHDDREVRIVACRALSKMGPSAESAVPEMAALLKVKDGRQRFQVSEALNQMGPLARKAVPVLVEQLNDLDKMSPNPVLTLLGKIGPDAKEAVPALIGLLKQKDNFMVDQIMLTLGQIGPAAKEAVPFMVARLDEKSEYRRKGAARALGELGPAAEAAIPRLKEALDDPNKMVRVWAAFALARITGKTEENVAVMIECWHESRSGKNDFGSANYDVAEALRLLGDKARPARDLMLKGLESRGTPPGTFHTLAQAISALLDDADVIVPKLVALLDAKVEGFNAFDRQAHLIEALGAFGPKAKSALPRLERFLKDGDEKVAEAAAAAIQKIGAKQGK
jgi:HEAT repeat protein